jgi:hypothetical protein
MLQYNTIQYNVLVFKAVLKFLDDTFVEVSLSPRTCCIPSNPYSLNVFAVLMGGEYKLYSYSLCDFLFYSYMIRTSTGIGLCTFLCVGDRVSHLNKTTGDVIVLYILILRFLDMPRANM